MAQKMKRREPRSVLIRRNRVPRVPGLRTIVLGQSNAGNLFDREIRDVLLTGQLVECRTDRPCNIVRSVLDAVRGASLDFQGCDFKDTAVRNCVFKQSTFGHSSWHYNSISDTQFESCSFAEMSMQHCDFERVTFSACDLRHIVIKTCRFSRCEFLDCQTNNKLFETCRLTECVFRKTDLQIDTLAENFGLTRSHYDGAIRSERGDIAHRTLSEADLRNWLNVARDHPLNKVNVEFFLTETLLNGSIYLDQSASLESWLPMFRTPGSFPVVLNQWIDFLLWLYQQDRVTVHTLLAFHSMTDELIRALEERVPEQSILSSLSGANLALARAIDSYLELLELCVSRSPLNVHLLVEGGAKASYYRRELGPMFESSGGRIESLVPHNSPWELTVSFGTASSTMLFVAMFLATRTSFELSKIRDRIAEEKLHGKGEKSGLARRPADTVDTKQLLTLEFGLPRPPATSPGLRLRAYLPGNLLAELRLTISSRQIAKFRRVLKEML
jgi:uncharacterized protein YjbI with pentapeptide repeats